MESRPIPHADALTFMFAGNATMTFKSLRTGKRFTYKIQQPKPERKGEQARLIWFVSLLTGSNNETDYTYMAYVKSMQGVKTLIHGRKPAITENAVSYFAFKYIFEHLIYGIPMPEVELWHEGHCCRCGRILTTPESIERGIGPECWSIMQEQQKTLSRH